jgi:signal transduction histidine kinase
MGRGSTPIPTTAYLGVICVTLAAALVAVGIAALAEFRRAPVAPRVEVYDAAGRLISATGRAEGRGDLVCSRSASGGTVCVEQLAAPPRVGIWLQTGAMAAGAAFLMAFIAAMMLRRGMARRFQVLSDTAGQAMREHDYSRRVPEDLGEVAAAMNALLGQMQEREIELKRRTTEVEAANKELESFVYAVSHDLRAPLGSIDGFAQAIEDEQLDESARDSLHWIRKACAQMRDLIEGLLEMSRLSRSDLQQDEVDLSSIARGVADRLRQDDPARQVRFHICDGVRAVGDSRLLRAVLENLMSNAWKFTLGREEPVIEFGVADDAFYVRDNGAGFDPSYAAKMFRPFQRLHSSREFEGTGIGLATVQKIAARHGGRAWAEGEVGKGATVYFTVGS